jgi:WhiB family redox-sensing transcriptional regulator
MIPAWTVDALCAQIGDVELFHPEKGGSPTEALGVCRECPVKAQCLEWILELEGRPGSYPYGVYGGTTATQRAALLGMREGGRCRDCGATIAHNVRLCDDCRVAARKATIAAHDAKRAAARADREARRAPRLVCVACGNRVRGDMPCPHCTVNRTDPTRRTA